MDELIEDVDVPIAETQGFWGDGPMPLRLQQFMFRIREARPLLHSKGVTDQELLWLLDIMARINRFGASDRFDWNMRSAGDHIVFSLHASGAHADDLELRDKIEAHIERHINPAKVLFSVLLHYKD